ncbi:MAG: Hsp20/alpha crystallin family protein [Flavobacteriales bacterium]|nr:Hsp20/alpha crystallin family protein [Flavobacteriales bacterium]MCX7768526.1 Hsp20/alpha crystallin family protein [Flavobacteriales bacterium]MDW8410228.1 Hsp20/alpha crystallin family protein [Flavobacteriales bacterium]
MYPVLRSTFPSITKMMEDIFDSDLFRFPLTDVSLPPVNISRSDDAYDIEMAVPGFQKGDFKISVEDGVLKISGEHKSEQEKKEKNYTRREFSFSSFERSFRLPEECNPENVTASYENGVLYVKVPTKPAIKKVHEIAVK